MTLTQTNTKQNKKTTFHHTSAVRGQGRVGESGITGFLIKSNMISY